MLNKKVLFHTTIKLGSGIISAWLFSALPAAAQAPTRSLLSGGLGDAMKRIAGIFGRNSGLQEVPLGFTVARVIFIFLSLLGMIAVSLIVYAGYHWLTARGNEEKVRKAQDTLRQAIWGLIIVLAAYSISYFLIGYLLGEFGGGPSAETSTFGT